MITGFLKVSSVVLLGAAVLLPVGLNAAFLRPELALENIQPIPWSGTADATIGINDGTFVSVVSPLNLETVLNAPVFSHTRRPFTPGEEPQPVQEVSVAAPDPQPVSFDPKSLRLLGVLLSDGLHKALIARPEFPNGEWLAVNETIGGWRVSSIEDNRVLLTAGESMIEIQQYVDKPEDELAAPNNNQ